MKSILVNSICTLKNLNHLSPENYKKKKKNQGSNCLISLSNGGIRTSDFSDLNYLGGENKLSSSM